MSLANKFKTPLYRANLRAAVEYYFKMNGDVSIKDVQKKYPIVSLHHIGRGIERTYKAEAEKEIFKNGF